MKPKGKLEGDSCPDRNTLHQNEKEVAANTTGQHHQQVDQLAWYSARPSQRCVCEWRLGQLTYRLLLLALLRPCVRGEDGSGRHLTAYQLKAGMLRVNYSVPASFTKSLSLVLIVATKLLACTQGSRLAFRGQPLIFHLSHSQHMSPVYLSAVAHKAP